MLACSCSDDGADGCAACEIYLLDSWVCDERIRDFSGVLGSVEDEIQYAGWETCFTHDVGDGGVAARRELGAFENAGVAGCDGVGEGSTTERPLCIPGNVSIRCVKGSQL